jgi:Domain of unknown function (DUF4440)
MSLKAKLFSAVNLLPAFLLWVGAAAITGCESSAHDRNGTREALIDLEKQSWQAWKDHDAGFFQNFLADDHLEIFSNGPINKEAVVRTVGSKVCLVENYSIDQFSVSLIGDDTGIVTYHAAQTTTCNGQPVPSPVWATSVYAKRGGRWVNVLYEQTTAAK